MNLGQVRDEVRGYLMNTDTSAPGWTNAELNGYINEGVFYVQQLTEMYWDHDVLEVTAGTATYAAPDNMHQFKRLTFDRVFLPQTNEYELDRDVGGTWRDKSGVPYRFFMLQHNLVRPYPKPDATGANYTTSNEFGEVIYFTLADGVTIDPNITVTSEFGVVTGFTDNEGSIIRLVPDPLNRFNDPELGVLIDFKTDKDNLGCIYVAIPDTLTLDADIPQLDDTAHPALIYYTLMRCFARDGEWQDITLARAWWACFLDWMESVFDIMGREFPTGVKSAEPFEAGNELAARLQAVGTPSQLLVLG